MTEAYENYNQLRVFKRPLDGRLPVVLPDDDADDSGRARRWIGLYLAKRITRPVQMLAAGAREIGAGRLDQRIEPRDARRVRVAGRGVQHDGGRARREPAQARTLDDRSRTQEPAARRAPPLHRDDPRAHRHRRRVGRRRRARSTTINTAALRLLDLDPSVVGQRVGRRVRRARISGRSTRLLQRGAPAVERAGGAGDRARARRAGAAPRRGRDGARGRGRRAGGRRAGVRRRDAADPGAEGRRVARSRAPARARNQEPADADSAVAPSGCGGISAPRPPPARALVDECTTTIVGEVESLKGLVDEFSQFARMPAPRTVPTDLTRLLDRHAGALQRPLHATSHRAAVRARRCRWCGSTSSRSAA